MALLDEVQAFLLEVVQGDLGKDPSDRAEAVNGAVGLVPLVYPLLDVRDLLREFVNPGAQMRDYIESLDEDDLAFEALMGQPPRPTVGDEADLAFAALACVPHFGRFIQDAVQPLYQERNAPLWSWTQPGKTMEQLALGISKGGVIRWITAIDWAQRTQEAVHRGQAAIEAYVAVLEAISAAPWWASAQLVERARAMLQQTAPRHAQLAQNIRTGTALVQGFVADLLANNAKCVEKAVQTAFASLGQDPNPTKGLAKATFHKPVQRAAKHPQTPPPALAPPPPAPAKRRKIELAYQYDDLRPIAGAHYEVTFANGDVRTGVLNAQGFAVLLDAPTGPYVVVYGEDPQPFQPESEKANTSYITAQAQKNALAQMQAQYSGHGGHGGHGGSAPG